MIIAVVSASAGMFLFLGGTLGGLAGRRPTPIWLGAGFGAIFGILVGSWLALTLADLPKTRNSLAAAFLGGLGGLVLVVGIPVIIGRVPNFFLYPFLGMISPGLGSALGTGWSLRIEEARTRPWYEEPARGFWGRLRQKAGAVIPIFRRRG